MPTTSSQHEWGRGCWFGMGVGAGVGVGSGVAESHGSPMKLSSQKCWNPVESVQDFVSRFIVAQVPNGSVHEVD